MNTMRSDLLAFFPRINANNSALLVVPIFAAVVIGLLLNPFLFFSFPLGFAVGGMIAWIVADLGSSAKQLRSHLTREEREAIDLLTEGHRRADLRRDLWRCAIDRSTNDPARIAAADKRSRHLLNQACVVFSIAAK